MKFGEKSQKKKEKVWDIKSPVEALSTFIRASRDPKVEQQLWIAKSIYDFLDPQNGQNTNVNLAKNGRFLDPFSISEL